MPGAGTALGEMMLRKARLQFWLVLVAALGSTPLAAQQAPDGGGSIPVPVDQASVDIDAIHPRARATARALGLPVRPLALDRNSLGTFNFPLQMTPAGRGASPFGISNFVDLDPSAGLLDWFCAQRTYNGHGGNDLYLWPFSWWMMDQGVVDIVAAAGGTIVQKQDGQYDRMCAGLSVNAPANFVVILQNDGAYAYYYHMKSGSVTTKSVGQTVVAGEKLGSVGSSGRTTGPHLHFELRDDVNAVIDAFAGVCNAGKTLWKHQWRAQADFRIIQVASLSAPPVFAPACPPNGMQTGTDTPNFQDQFSPGQTVLATVFLRDQSATDVVTVQVFRPDGTMVVNGQTGVPPSFYSSSYWYFTYTLPGGAQTGTWRIRGTTTGGQVMEHTFFVSAPPASASLVGAVLPSGRSIRTNTAATVFATILNASNQTAQGCWIQPETPLNALFSFQTTDPNDNTPTGSPNTNVNIPALGSQSFVLAFTPDPASNAQAVSTTLRFKCSNSDAAPVFDTVNTLLLSFDANPVPDIIPIAATLSNDGVVRIPGPSAQQVWAAASTNIGSGATLTVAPVVKGSAAVAVTICETNPSTGVCLAPPSTSVSPFFATSAVHTFSLFVQAGGTVPFDPANRRVDLNFTDSQGIVRGRTGVAVTTQ
jgi:Peptidase family M23